MDNLNITTPILVEEDMNQETSSTQISNEEVMSQQDIIVQMFKDFLSDGGSPKVTEFKRHLNNLINSSVKPLCSRAGKLSDGSDWKSQLNSRFSGRGAKWVKLDASHIESDLLRFEEEGLNCDLYRSYINEAGYAFIRFSGPRINNDQQTAAFEIRINGSTNDHPKQLCYIAVDQLENIIEPLNGTPRSMKLETKPEVIESDSQDKENIDSATQLSEVDEGFDKDNLNDVFDDFMDDDSIFDDELNDAIF